MDMNIRKFSSRLLDIIKSDGATNNVVNIVSFMLLLKKRGFLSDIKIYFYGNNTAYEFITSILYNHSGCENLIDIWDVVGNDFKMLKESTVKELAYILNEVFLDEDLGTLFDEIITQTAKDFSKGIGESFQPLEISKLIFKLGDSSTFMDIYNPFAGLASYGVYFGKRHHYVGQEINANTWALGKIRLILNNAYVYDYKLEDSIQNWNSLEKQYDLLVSTPPFGYWRNPYLYSGGDILPANSYEEFFILNGINNALKQGGKLIGLFSEGLLFGSKKSQHLLRKEVIEAGFVEMIISLPSNIFYNTSINTSVIVLNKGNFNDRKSVKFIDGSSFYKNIGGKNILQTEVLLNAIEYCDKKYVRTISTEDIKKNNYRLDVRSYFINKIEIPAGYKKIKLKEVLKYNNKREKVLDANKNILSISDLTDNQFDYEKQYNHKSNHERSRTVSAYYTFEDILLVSLRFKNIKPTYYRSSNSHPIYYSQNLTGFYLLLDQIDISYLINELNADYVKQQVTSFSIGSVMSYIRVSDFLNIEILVPPSIEEQKAIVKGAKEAYQIASVKELGLEGVIEKMKTEYIDEMRIKKHNLAQYVNSLQSSVSALIKFIKKNNGTISDEQLISIQRHITIEQHLQNMMNTTNEIGTFVNSLTNDLEFGDARNINLNDFISRYIDNYPQDKFEFKYYIDKESFIDNNKKFAPTTAISEPDLKEIFNNIVKNAENHGFVDATKKNYIISISLSFDINKNMLRIDIANNGKPMPSGMDESRYTLKNEKAGITGNEGLGGFRISQIIGHFGGELKLSTNEQEEFPVTITLYLPLIKIE
ncbi:MAG: N-6 DNA methylase [Fibrobacter sp.]|nr:N-6 DNA methylase [Fibrobacter sp.]